VTLDLWSTTRTDLHPRAELLTKVAPEKMPVKIGEKVVVPKEKLNSDPASNPSQPPEPWQAKSQEPGQVKCAYRIPVQLLERSPDGSRPFAFGGFRIRVKVTFDDKDNIEPIVFNIGGSLRGDIRAGSAEQGRLNFGTFPAREGSAEQE